jgi:hypothetical protein
LERRQRAACIVGRNSRQHVLDNTILNVLNQNVSKGTRTSHFTVKLPSTAEKGRHGRFSRSERAKKKVIA